ncbi:hypothetical protein M6B38_391735 [Iris pallida]|uniref:Uncharacterized protein n=1 Tax=Iris pallida TaxID=29817 RepID=A0AAX6FYS1_IRIPA|nr:hypothetical protein M6B38_391735 [Iris pallida]
MSKAAKSLLHTMISRRSQRLRLGHANGDSAGANSNVGGYDDDFPGRASCLWRPLYESHHEHRLKYNRIARNLPTPNNH